MSFSNLVDKLHHLSNTQVIVRGREYQRQYNVSEVIGFEIQVIACTPGNEPEFIRLWYTNPPPSPVYYYLHPLRLRSQIWISEDSVQEAWRAHCDYWVNVPGWLSPKPIVFCRQFQEDDDHVTVDLPDLIFARELERLMARLEQHKLWIKHRLRQAADKVPPEKRGASYSALLHDTNARQGLMGMIGYRLGSLVDEQFNALSSKLDIVRVQPKKRR